MYTYKGNVYYIVDGDTFDIKVDMGFHIFIDKRFRLTGIDTPETWRPESKAEAFHGKLAEKFVSKLIKDETIIINSLGIGVYNRWNCEIFLPNYNKKSLSDILNENGYGKLSYDEYETIMNTQDDYENYILNEVVKNR